MSKEIRDFERDMRIALKAIKGASEKVVKKAAIDTFGAVIDDTPVGDPALWATPYAPNGYQPGTLKSNWVAQVGSAPSGFIEGQQDASGSSTKSAMKGTVKSWDVSQELYFANNAPYAGIIEFGYSSQAPQGMYRLNIAKFNGLVAKYAKQEGK